MTKLYKLSILAGLLVLSSFVFTHSVEASYSFEASPGSTNATITITNTSGSPKDSFNIITTDHKFILYTSDAFAFSVADQEYTFTVPTGTLVPEREYVVQVNGLSTLGSFLDGSFTTTPYLGSDCTGMKFRCIWEIAPATIGTPENGSVPVTLHLGQVNIDGGTKIWATAGLHNQKGKHQSAPVTVNTETFDMVINAIPTSGEIYTFEIRDENLYEVYSVIEDIYIAKPVVEIDLGGSDLTPQYCLDHPDEYCLLEPIPQFGASVDTSDLQGYFTKIISLILMLGSAFAVLMIVYGGVLYMGSESVFKKGEGLAKVEGAIFGLLLLVGAYSILNSINPSLVNLEIKLRPVTYNISYEEAAEEASTNTDGTYNYGNCKVAPKTDEKCPTCRPLSEITVVSSGKEANDTLADKLELFNQSIGASNWRVTEAYAPSPIHCAQCHYNGTCIDAGLNEKTVANIKSFYDKALEAGLGPVYEVLPSQTSLYNELTAAGVKVIIPKKITAPHFSVYCKPGVTNGC